MDLVDAKYVFAGHDPLLPDGKLEKAGTHNPTFTLGNQDYGDGEVNLPALMKILARISFKGWITIDPHYTPAIPRYS